MWTVFSVHVSVYSPLVQLNALCNLLQCSKAAECPLLLCQAHTRVHQVWSGNLRRWKTLEMHVSVFETGLVCLVWSTSMFGVCFCCLRELCLHPHAHGCVWFCLCVCTCNLMCMHAFFPLFSHSGTLSSERCANQSAEKERWERLSGGDKIWSRPWCLNWDKHGRQNKGESCWIRKSGALNLVPDTLLKILQMFHCKYKQFKSRLYRKAGVFPPVNTDSVWS